MRHGLRRLLASVTITVLALSLVAPPLVGGRAASRDCPFAPATGGPALVAGMDGGGCEHTAAPCLGTFGCVTMAPAIGIVPTLLVVPNSVITLAPRPAPHFGDLFRTGPPTPPPNHS